MFSKGFLKTVIPQIPKKTAFSVGIRHTVYPTAPQRKLTNYNVLVKNNYSIACKNIRRSFGSVNQTVPHHSFHTSSPNRALPPILVLLLRPLTKIAAVLFGRGFRKWWQSLPPDKKDLFLARIRRNKFKIIGSSVAVTGLGYMYYQSHTEEMKFTGRKRFMAFTHHQLKAISDVEFEIQCQLHASKIVHPTHPVYKRIVAVVNRLLTSNKDIPEMHDKQWTVTVVNDHTVKNAFVLPGGNIFVFSGMLYVCENDDQLGIVLSHEMAHAVLGHMAEHLSHAHMIDIIMLLPMVVIWAILPDLGALFSQWLAERLSEVLLHLPFSRKLEVEADKMGLYLAAKSCFDVREASAFWGRMALFNDLDENGDVIEWLSTHPRHENREAMIEECLPEALALREISKCPMLPFSDPRTKLNAQKKHLLASKAVVI